jgi:hypothetical protein
VPGYKSYWILLVDEIKRTLAYLPSHHEDYYILS